MDVDPRLALIAIASGILPTLVWLWFWLREDNDRPEPRGLLILTFLAGMFCVALVLPLQRLAYNYFGDSNTLVAIAGSIEEIIKFLVVAVVVMPTKRIDEPVDYPVYFITVALGFSALENTLFLFDPITNSEATVSLLTGSLRFLGASVLHTVTSASIGIALGLAFGGGKIKKFFYTISGLGVAIVLHSVFNLIIMDTSGDQFWKMYGLLWAIAVIIMLFFEKLRRISNAIYYKLHKPFTVKPYVQ